MTGWGILGTALIAIGMFLRTRSMVIEFRPFRVKLVKTSTLKKQ